ncbi:hypothetical protein PROFUN_13450 [Planoprotostelium fungivorum]|uniref:Uncharacterized protein n=1 Tax=Planoprotostelium fungivorum TaxID=1890364 RepID=A0A2P6N3Y8_9EUKA|nr:hypothetical protein PROFUN_13450 [Planoprotostelium fungivorum]
MTNNISTDGFGLEDIHSRVDEVSRVLSACSVLPQRELSINLASEQCWDRYPLSQSGFRLIEGYITGPALFPSTGTVSIDLRMENHKPIKLCQSVVQISADGKFTLDKLNKIPRYNQICASPTTERTEMHAEIVVELFGGVRITKRMTILGAARGRSHGPEVQKARENNYKRKR